MIDVRAALGAVTAWQILKRHPCYRDAWQAVVDRTARPEGEPVPIRRQTEADLESAPWGLLAWEDPFADDVEARIRPEAERFRPGAWVQFPDQHAHAGPEGRAPRPVPRVLPGQQRPARRQEVGLGLHPERERRRLETGRAALRKALERAENHKATIRMLNAEIVRLNSELRRLHGEKKTLRLVSEKATGKLKSRLAALQAVGATLSRLPFDQAVQLRTQT